MTDSALSLEMACYQAVHAYPGGVPAVAATYGWRASTLQNKLNPTQSTHKLTAIEVEGILQLTKDGRILDALCAQRQAVWVDLSALEVQASDMAILDGVNDLVNKVGKLTGEISKSLADGRVDEEELAQLEQALMDMNKAGFAVIEQTKQFM